MASDFTIEVKLPNLEKLEEALKQVQKIKLKIGIKEDAVYPNGTPVSEVATYLEYGWVQNVTKAQRGYLLYKSGVNVGGTLSMPPRPIFGYTIQTNKAKWQKIGSTLFKNFPENPYQVALKAFYTLGQMATDDLKITINSNGLGSFAPRSPLTLLMYGSELEDHAPKGSEASLKKRNVSKLNTSNDPKALKRTSRMLNSIGFEITEGE